MLELTVEQYFKRLDAHEEASGILDCRKAVVNNAKYKIKETFTPSKQLLNYMYSKSNRQHANELNASMTTRAILLDVPILILFLTLDPIW